MTVPKEWLQNITEIIGKENIISDPLLLEPYSHDEYPQKEIAVNPQLALIPGSEEEISRIVKECGNYSIPITTRGGGTGLSGGCVPAQDSIVISLKRLNKVVSKNRSNRTITVQAGMPLHNLYQEVESLDLFFPPHPGDEGAFIGGAVATNAGGARAVKYGTVKSFVRGIQVVLPDGNITQFGGEIVKSSAGYNLRDLFIGSEGTLGIITQVTLMLLPKSNYTTTLIAPYDSIHDAIGTVPKIITSGIIPTAVEFIEHSVLRGIEKMLNLQWPAQTGIASLMFILDGKSEDIVMEDAEKLAALLESSGANDILIAENKAKQAEILKIRSSIYESLREAIVELFDICVPVSEIANHIDFVHYLEEKYDCCLPSFGHAADGNVHTHFLNRKLVDGVFKDPVPDWENTLKKVKKELFNDAVKRGGVISGEHGIGKTKRRYLEETLGSVQVGIMRKIKQTIDPLNIMNPDKIL